MYLFLIYIFLYITKIAYLSYCVQYNARAIMMIIIITMVIIIIIITKIIAFPFGIFTFNFASFWFYLFI